VSSTQVVSATNRLLTALPRKDREQLLANCEQIELNFAEELYRFVAPYEVVLRV
jgi:hypothetical protein